MFFLELEFCKAATSQISSGQDPLPTSVSLVGQTLIVNCDLPKISLEEADLGEMRSSRTACLLPAIRPLHTRLQHPRHICRSTIRILPMQDWWVCEKCSGCNALQDPCGKSYQVSQVPKSSCIVDTVGGRPARNSLQVRSQCIRNPDDGPSRMFQHPPKEEGKKCRWVTHVLGPRRAARPAGSASR